MLITCHHMLQAFSMLAKTSISRRGRRSSGNSIPFLFMSFSKLINCRPINIFKCLKICFALCVVINKIKCIIFIIVVLITNSQFFLFLSLNFRNGWRTSFKKGQLVLFYSVCLKKFFSVCIYKVTRFPICALPKQKNVCMQ